MRTGTGEILAAAGVARDETTGIARPAAYNMAFLDTYERSDHPARIEALRWLQPALERHLRALSRHRRIAEEARGNS